MTERRYTWLKDYAPPIYRQQSISLEFFLDPEKTILKSNMLYELDCDEPADLVLQGENIQLNYLKIDDTQIGLDCLIFGRNTLTIPKKKFSLQEDPIRDGKCSESGNK